MTSTTNQQMLDYAIIGAGPAGLQIGSLLTRVGRRYLIIEAASRPATFFETQPRHRTLLSINKPHNHYPEKDYNLRHDWNSLLSDDDTLLFRNYTDALYPSADDLVRYMRDFADKQALTIRYDTRVTKVRRLPTGEGFELELDHGDPVRARCVLVATGAVAEHLPEIEGLEHASTYSTHDLDPDVYRNKKVAIVGGGNSGMEVANHLAGAAAAIHILMREPVKHAWQTHFVGDLRAINNTVLDMYQLKSLHATLGLLPKRIEKRADGTLRVTLEEGCPHWSTPGTFEIKHDYDHVIVCTGWRYIDTSWFSDDCAPETTPCGTAPILSPSWETSVPGLFFIGTSMAARDKRAASGFIHGYRYNIRSLFHMLEERYHDTTLPATQFEPNSAESLRTFAKHIVQRVSTSSALYQMNGFLVDLIIAGSSGLQYIDELPLEYVRERSDFHDTEHCFTISLEYGFHKYPAGLRSLDFIHPSDVFDTTCSAFLHPIIRYWKGGEVVDEMHLGESLMVRYDSHFSEDSFGPGYTKTYAQLNENKVMNFINGKLGVTDEVFSEQLLAESLGKFFRPWSKEEIAAYHASRVPSDAVSSCEPPSD